MPKMDGQEAIQHIKEYLKQIPSYNLKAVLSSGFNQLINTQ